MVELLSRLRDRVGHHEPLHAARAGHGGHLRGRRRAQGFIQITATSVAAQRGNGQASPHVAAIQITTDNTVFGGAGGAGVSWRKEAAEGRNVMVFTDLTIALPLLCQGLAEAYGLDHVHPACAAIAADLRRALAKAAPAGPDVRRTCADARSSAEPSPPLR
jgi:hypothetical protein